MCKRQIHDPPYIRLEDRWQAASDMGGTAIPGSHWIELDFKKVVHVSAVVLDWETAYAKDYRLESRQSDHGKWMIFYNGSEEAERSGYPVL